MPIIKRKTVFVAMSGGVDSSVAAALLKKDGYKIVGVFMKPWTPQLSAIRYQMSDNCLWKQDREDAARVAAKLGIPLLTWDLSEEYEKKVARYMINGYRRGITPNPDVMCNKHIKFGAFLRRALKEGADFIATGHYVRLRRTTINNLQLTINKINKLNGQMSNVKCQMFHLLRAKDGNKDQTYFLYTLTQRKLRHCLFPIGEYTKPQVRKLAKKFDLPNWDKKDSQGVCFVGDLKMNEFLKNYIPPRKGKIVRQSDEKMLGYHDGAWYFTIGQRHGLHLGGNKEVYFVVDKDAKNNIIYVDTKQPASNLYNQEMQIKNFIWTNGAPPRFPLKAAIKLRYRQPEQTVTLTPTKTKNGLKAVFARPQRAVTPGQAAVIYRDQRLIGGGVIEK